MPHRNLQDYLGLGRSKVVNHLKAQSTKDTASNRADAFLWNNFWGFVWHYVRSRFGFRYPYQYYPTKNSKGIFSLPNEVTVCLLSDWASDTPEADGIGRLVTSHNPDVSIHLGDVYFVGTPQEIRNNFTVPSASWPRGRLGSLALAGNHEMYSNGRGFFEVLLPSMGIHQKNAFYQQEAGFFCLENDHWRVIGLDTGYTSVKHPFLEVLSPPDCTLRPEQVRWLNEQVRLGDVSDKRGIILMSHHPYYSAFAKNYPKLGQQLVKIMGEAQRPVLWFWGHEHRLVVYRPFAHPKGITALGRCIGHGGMPMEQAQPKHTDTILFYDDTAKARLGDVPVGLNGFAKLVFQEEMLTVEYRNIRNELDFYENFTVEELNSITPTEI